MDPEFKKILQEVANTIRGLSVDAVEKANSGHPGLPLGCAEIGAYLFSKLLIQNPHNPKWLNRDRFILSAGHGSMLLYSCLYLAGFDLSLEDIKNFRQLHSPTPGHPEYLLEKGIECTTGPLGQGIGNGAGLAIAYKILKKKFNTPNFTIFDNRIYVLASDGCFMEGSTSEVSSLAGHLNLDNLVVIYDANNICLDGPTAETFSEDVRKRYHAYGWEVYEIDGHDFDAIDEVFMRIKESQTKPVLILAHTMIGKGSPNKEGTHKVHGSPLGAEEHKLTKEQLGISEEFFVPKNVKEFFKKRVAEQKRLEHEWNEKLKEWKKLHPELYEEFELMQKKIFSKDIEKNLINLSIKEPIASRSGSGIILNHLVEKLPYLYGGSADLSSSDMTVLKNCDIIRSDNFKGRSIKYGVREFAMGTITNGLAYSQMILPFAGTFLTFSDYMRSTIRLAALASLQIVYQFTHDSIFLGQDGPTHQPIEHLASLRAIPNLQVIRPADAMETKMAWIAAFNHKGPTALILSRQPLESIPTTHIPFSEGMANGAYIIKKEDGKLDFTIFASGSEVKLAIDVANSLEKMKKGVRVISFPCFELFEKSSKEYKDKILPKDGKTVSIEAGSEFGWHKYIGRDGISISIDKFGLSAPAEVLAKEFGFTVEHVLQKIL